MHIPKLAAQTGTPTGKLASLLKKLAEWTGLEPATPGVTGRVIARAPARVSSPIHIPKSSSFATFSPGKSNADSKNRAWFAALLLTLATAADAAGQPDQLHFILRPDAAGAWYIQNDKDHASIGVHPQVEQHANRLRVRFERTYAKAVVIQITSDDGFADRISGHASLGTADAVIFVVARGKGTINPRDVWQHAGTPGNGNLWVTITMLDPK